MAKVKVYLITVQKPRGRIRTIARVEGTIADARRTRNRYQSYTKQYRYGIVDHTILEDNECAFRGEPRNDLNVRIRD
jgi:hypothetical protein